MHKRGSHMCWERGLDGLGGTCEDRRGGGGAALTGHFALQVHEVVAGAGKESRIGAKKVVQSIQSEEG